MTSRTFTQTASFLPFFKKKYTASTENALEKFYQLCWLPGSSVLKIRLIENNLQAVSSEQIATDSRNKHGESPEEKGT
jgi:hypothetical protein